jgi:hypothetical protein
MLALYPAQELPTELYMSFFFFFTFELPYVCMYV